MKWYLEYDAVVGGEWDEVVGGNNYQGYIWQSDGHGGVAVRYAVEEKGDAESITELLNDRENLIAVVGNLLHHYAQGHEDNPEIKRARAALEARDVAI